MTIPKLINVFGVAVCTGTAALLVHVAVSDNGDAGAGLVGPETVQAQAVEGSRSAVVVGSGLQDRPLARDLSSDGHFAARQIGRDLDLQQAVDPGPGGSDFDQEAITILSQDAGVVDAVPSGPAPSVSGSLFSAGGSDDGGRVYAAADSGSTVAAGRSSGGGSGGGGFSSGGGSSGGGSFGGATGGGSAGGGGASPTRGADMEPVGFEPGSDSGTDGGIDAGQTGDGEVIVIPVGGTDTSDDTGDSGGQAGIDDGTDAGNTDVGDGAWDDGSDPGSAGYGDGMNAGDDGAGTTGDEGAGDASGGATGGGADSATSDGAGDEADDADQDGQIDPGAGQGTDDGSQDATADPGTGDGGQDADDGDVGAQDQTPDTSGSDGDGSGGGGTVTTPRPWTRDDAVNYLEQFGIRWTFDKELSLEPEPGKYQYGTFANGDYWVVGPVNIIAIDPPSTVDGSGRWMHGSMIDPDPVPANWEQALSYHGYDSTGYSPGSSLLWQMPRRDLNVALGVDVDNPLHIEPVRSLISTISFEEPHHTPQLKTAAVLTIVSEPPGPGAFRPPYCKIQDKGIRYYWSQVNTSLLKNLTPPPGLVPSIDDLTQGTRRPWLDHVYEWPGRRLHPQLNMPEYGREIAKLTADAALVLNFDYELEIKRPLLINYLQIAIDLHGIIEGGSNRHFRAAAGHLNGRKLPIVFAAKLFDCPIMKETLRKAGDYLYSDGHYPTNFPEDGVEFSEDAQIFYVTQREVDWTNGPEWDPYPQELDFATPYTEEMIGLPEWGRVHYRNPYKSIPSWEAIYRSVCGPTYVGTGMAVLIFEARDLWNHDAFFDYMDRWQNHPKSSPWHFYTRVYNMYRNDYPPVWSAAPEQE